MKMKLNDDLARRRWRLEERDLAIKAHHDAVMAARYDPVLEQGDVWVNDDIRDLTVTVEADGVTVDGVWDRVTSQVLILCVIVCARARVYNLFPVDIPGCDGRKRSRWRADARMRSRLQSELRR